MSLCVHWNPPVSATRLSATIWRMTSLNPKKLLLTKWTAVRPIDRQKHFLVTKVFTPDDPAAAIEWVEIEALMTGACQQIVWRSLLDERLWRQGWVSAL